MPTRRTKAAKQQQTVLAPVADNGPPINGCATVNADDVRLLAYQKWIAAGAPPGDGVAFWLDAERELFNGTPQQGAHP